jgi:hypothetical protein
MDDVSRRVKLQVAAKKSILEQLDVVFDEPNETCKAMQQLVAQHTLLRTDTRTKGQTFL